MVGLGALQTDPSPPAPEAPRGWGSRPFHLVRGLDGGEIPQGRGGRQKGGEALLGYSKGGFGTKIHLLCEAGGVPIAARLSEGQRHESLYLEALVQEGERETGILPIRLSGDKAYSAPRIRDWLTGRGIRPVIPYRRDELDRMKEPPELDRETYRGRNAIERLIGRLKEMRAVATRSDKLAKRYLAILQLAMIRLLLRKIAPPDTA
jgi:transposase